MQSWTGCSDTIPLARFAQVPETSQTPELFVEPPGEPGLPAVNRTRACFPESAGELSIAQTQEMPVPKPALNALHWQEHPVCPPAAPVRMDHVKQPSLSGSQNLWHSAQEPPEIAAESLRAGPEEPSEVRYRVWIQPLNDSAGHDMRRAGPVSCHLADLPGPDVTQAALASSGAADAPRFLDAAGFVAGGLVAHHGAALQGIVAADTAEFQYLLYPASRRMPHPPVNGLG